VTVCWISGSDRFEQGCEELREPKATRVIYPGWRANTRPAPGYTCRLTGQPARIEPAARLQKPPFWPLPPVLKGSRRRLPGLAAPGSAKPYIGPVTERHERTLPQNFSYATKEPQFGSGERKAHDVKSFSAWGF